MKKYTIEEFFESTKSLVIHTPTKEQANKLLKAFHEAGEKWWRVGKSYLDENYWEEYKKDTFYSNDNRFGSIKINYCDYKIINFEDIIFEEEEENKMNKNHMKEKEVAKMLGVEIGEGFNIFDEDGDELSFNPYHFTKEGLVDCDGDVAGGNLERLIRGDWTLQKLPFIPKEGDWYFWIEVNGNVIKTQYASRILDYYCIKAKNCFRTREEITQEIKDRIVKEMKEGIKQ